MRTISNEQERLIVDAIGDLSLSLSPAILEKDVLVTEALRAGLDPSRLLYLWRRVRHVRPLGWQALHGPPLLHRCSRTQGNHVAIVDYPADKKCRVVSFAAEGGKRNRMTWRIEPANTGERGKKSPATQGSAISDGLTCEVIIATGVGDARTEMPDDKMC